MLFSAHFFKICFSLNHEKESAGLNEIPDKSHQMEELIVRLVRVNQDVE